MGDILNAVRFGNKSKVQEYIKGKNDVNALDHDKNTLLMIAAKKGWYHVAEMLIDNGADIKLKNKDDITALHIATHGYYHKLVKLLLEKGACAHEKDSRGNTPLHYISMTIEDDKENRLPSATMDYLVEKYDDFKLEIDLGNLKGETPLHLAAEKGLEHVGQYFLRNRARLNAIDETMETPFHKAVNHTNMIKMFLYQDNVSSFINCTNKDGDSALHKASRNGAEADLETGFSMIDF